MDAAPNSPWGTSPYQQAVSVGDRRHALKWAVAGLAALLVAGGGFAYYRYVYRAASPLPLSVAIDAEPLTPGSATSLDVTVANPSREIAYDAEVSVTLPDRTTARATENAAASSTGALPVISLGNVPAGGTATVRLQLDTNLDPSSAVPVGASVSYATAKDRTKRFTADAASELVVEQAAVSLTVDAPNTVTRAEPFTATVRYRANAAPLARAVLKITVPRGLTLVQAAPALSGGSFVIASVPQGGSGTLSLTLKADAVSGAQLPLVVTLTGSDGAELAEQSAPISVATDALSARVTVNGKDQDAVALNQTLSYDISVKNLSAVPLKDVRVDARIAGALFDLSSVQAQNGTLSAKEPVVTWTGVGVPELRVVNPGTEVRLHLNVRTVRALAATSVAAPVTVTASSPTVPPGVSASQVTATASASVRLAATTSFAATAYWKDPLGQVATAGPQPPRVGVATRYLIRWTVAPSGGDLKDAVVTAALAPGVAFTGTVVGVPSANVVYDARTGQVTWRAGSVKAGASVRTGFQVEVTPAQNQSGRAVPLAGRSKLAATDAFTGEGVAAEEAELSTVLRNDASGQGSGIVQ